MELPIPTGKPGTDALDCEAHIRIGSRTRRKIDLQQLSRAYYGCHKDRLWDPSLCENDGMGLEGRAPSGFLGLVQLFGGVVDCLLNNIIRYAEGA